MSDVDLLLTDATLCRPSTPTGSRSGPNLQRLDVMEGAQIGISEGVVDCVLDPSDVSDNMEAGETRSLEGRVVTPGLVDPHTHSLYAGTRADEFEARNQGATYQEIADKGGGILRTVRATREAPDEVLRDLLRARLDRLLDSGTTTCEIKTGYGLSAEQELRHLRIIQDVAEEHPVTVVPTFMGAHAVPSSYRDRPEDYVEYLTGEMISAAGQQGIARFCDVFCDEEAFSAEQARKVLVAAKEEGMVPKVHTGEFREVGGAKVAAEVGAASADHLEDTPLSDLETMAEAGVVGVLLPGTRHFLGLDQVADYEAMKEAGLRVALGTDHNPGTCTATSMSLVMTLAGLDFGMGHEEAIVASTTHAAEAVGEGERKGMLREGADADVVVWDLEHPREIPYIFGNTPVESVYVSGNRVR